jgi:hypothetical protein
VHEGGLSRSIGADEPNSVAEADVEGYVAEKLFPGEKLADSLCSDHDGSTPD